MKSSSVSSNIIRTYRSIKENGRDFSSLKRELHNVSQKGSFYVKQQLKYNSYRFTNPTAFKQLQDTIFIIYTMGKVGSTTLYSTLWEKVPHNSLYHVHFLSERGMKKREEFSRNPDVTQDDRALASYIENNPHKRLKIITLVREPLSRDISDLFQCLHIYFPNKKVDEISEVDLRGKLASNNFAFTLEWFDEEFKPYLKYDIYNIPFDKEKGYKIYTHETADILLIRLEDLSRCYREALYEFVGIDFPELINVNLTDNKDSAQLNKEFKRHLKLDKKLLEELYASKFVRHFYSDREITQFINKYSA